MLRAWSLWEVLVYMLRQPSSLNQEQCRRVRQHHLPGDRKPWQGRDRATWKTQPPGYFSEHSNKNMHACACICVSRTCWWLGSRVWESQESSVTPKILAWATDSASESTWEKVIRAGLRMGWRWAIHMAVLCCKNLTPGFLMAYHPVSKALKKNSCWDITGSFGHNPTEHVRNSCCYCQPNHSGIPANKE